MNRIEIARQYMEELLSQRQDIVAAWLAGSVARGEETDQSDIDLALMVAGTGDVNRAGLDTWREGIYIEAGLVFQQGYTDLEAVLNDPFKATHMNDALILYDPSGFVTQMQNAVRPIYMQPQWLGRRLAFWLDNIHTSLARFRAAVTAVDRLEICAAFGFFTFGCVSIPLLHAGMTPSSTRGLLLLGRIAPMLKAQLAELEGSTQMSAADVLAFEPLLQETIPLGDASYGQLGIYFMQKTLWMAHQGQHQEALHAMWLMMYGAAEGSLQHTDPAERAIGIDLAHRWLQRTGMHEPARLAAKLQQAEMLLGQLEVLVEESSRR
jgi:hypothetical protein